MLRGQQNVPEGSTKAEPGLAAPTLTPAHSPPPSVRTPLGLVAQGPTLHRRRRVGGGARVTAVSGGHRWGTHQRSAQGWGGWASRGEDKQTPTCCCHSQAPAPRRERGHSD